jgi:hypothetical protein
MIGIVAVFLISTNIETQMKSFIWKPFLNGSNNKK